MRRLSVRRPAARRRRHTPHTRSLFPLVGCCYLRPDADAGRTASSLTLSSSRAFESRARYRYEVRASERAAGEREEEEEEAMRLIRMNPLVQVDHAATATGQRRRRRRRRQRKRRPGWNMGSGGRGEEEEEALSPPAAATAYPPEKEEANHGGDGGVCRRGRSGGCRLFFSRQVIPQSALGEKGRKRESGEIGKQHITALNIAW